MTAKTTPAAAPSAPEQRPTFQAWYALAIFVLALLFGFVDRQILVLVTEPLKQEMHLTDVQIGLIQGLGPGLFGAVGVLILGWLADRTARQVVFALCILAWSVATACCGLAQTFDQLFIASVAIVLGEAALVPVLYSVLPDLFPGRSRITANLIYMAANTIGIGFGITLGGAVLTWISTHRGMLPDGLQGMAAWRLVFIALAVPGLPIALAVLAIGRIPRSVEKRAEQAIGSLRSYFKEHGQTAVAFCLAFSTGVMSLIVVSAWAPVYVIRALGAPAGEVGVRFGAVYGIGSAVGVTLAFVASRLLVPRIGVIAPIRLFQASLLTSLIPMLLLLMIRHPWQAYGLLGIQITITMIGVALTPTVWQDISPGRLRGRIIALAGVVTVLIQYSGPLLVGALSDALSNHSRGLLWAIVIVAVTSTSTAAALLWLNDRAFHRTLQSLTTA